MGFSALIVAAGTGERAGGGLPKQYRPVAGKPLIRWSAEAFLDHPKCDELIVAAHPDHYDRLNAALAGLAFTVAEGGATRSASVENGLAAASCDQVFIHDAARPAVSAALIGRLLAALEDHAGAAPALPVADALARTGENEPEPVNRDGLVRLQTPQAFRAADLRGAFAKTPGREFPDELALARAAGLDVALVPGEEANFKLTWPEDFDRMDRQLQPAPRQALPVAGTGFDVHRLGPGEGVTLCGVFIACPFTLIGHSDADAGLHALTDAVLGAAGLGDIGQHFPPSDMRWKGADSAQFLIHAVRLAREAGVRPVNADITVICETPKIGPHREAMVRRVAELTGLPAVRVNVKATTTERLGFTGRGEGVAAQAVFSGVIA